MSCNFGEYLDNDHDSIESEDTLQLTKKANNNKISNQINDKKTSTEFPLLKNMPYFFAALMLIFLTVVFMNFSQSFYQFCLQNPKLSTYSKNRLNIKYVSSVFAEMDTLSKFVFLCAHLILYIMAIALKSFSDFRNTNILSNLFDRNHYLQMSCIFFNLFSMLFLIFTPQSLNIFIKSNPDAPLFFIYAFSIFFMELYLFKLASTVLKNGLENDNNITVRKYCLLINAAQLGFYIISWFILEFFPMDNNLQNFLILVLTISLNSNCFLFFVSFMIFVFLLKSSLEQITFEIKILHPEEYFIDFNNCNKNVL